MGYSMMMICKRASMALGLVAALAVVPACGSVGDDDNASTSTNNGNTNGSNNTNTNGSNNVNASGKATGEGPCGEPSECKNNVCVAIIDGNNPPNYCTQQCSGSNPCPSGFWCDSETFQLVGLSFCRFGATEPENPEPPSEPPKLPCKTDDDCEGDTVCAEFQGERECTITCTSETDCDVPSVGGISVDLLTCGQDEGQDRTVCLPDLDCYPNVASCISGFPGL